MNIAKINKFDTANGIGVRTSIFVSGCEHYCKGCFNEEAWDFNYGNELTKEVALEVVNNLKNPNIKGLSILGGEPLHPKNLEGVFLLISTSKFLADNNKDIWLWTGYTFEELLSRKDGLTVSILNLIDVLVDGKFELDKKDLNLKYRGSTNQRVINVKESLKRSEVILWEK